MKRRLGIAAGLALLSPAFVSADELEEFALRFAAAEDKAWQHGDVSDLEQIEDPSIVYYWSDQVLTAGFEAHKDYILANREGLRSLQQEWQYLTGDGDVFSMKYKSTAIMQTEKSDVDALFVFRVEDGKIVEVWANGTMSLSPLE